MNLSTWLRTFSISMAITVVNSLVILFSVLSLPMSDSWVSWQRAHLHVLEVFIVTVKRQTTGIEINWWGLRVITICYIFLVLVLGEEGRVIIGRLRKGTKKISLGVPFLNRSSVIYTMRFQALINIVSQTDPAVETRRWDTGVHSLPHLMIYPSTLPRMV